MKKTFLLIPLVCSFLYFSCSDNKPKDEPVIQEQTPEILDNSKPDISSVSKRYASDILQELFNEAAGKDSKLKELSDRMTEIGEMKNDSLQPFREYLHNNDMYWQSAYNYINQLNDSILKNEFREIFKNMEAKYKKSISNHNLVLDNLDNREIALHDYEILMKLSVTAPMITNYQKNELPALDGLNRLIGSYDTLIIATKKYTKTVK